MSKPKSKRQNLSVRQFGAVPFTALSKDVIAPTRDEWMGFVNTHVQMLHFAVSTMQKSKPELHAAMVKLSIDPGAAAIEDYLKSLESTRDWFDAWRLLCDAAIYRVLIASSAVGDTQDRAKRQRRA